MPDAVALPRSREQLAAILSWCYERDVPIVPRGGGTGFSAGAVPLDGGVVVGVERLTAIDDVDPESWTLRLGAGLRTWDVQRLARESGLWYPVDPGAGEVSCIGGNVATNAGGPHAFKYGVTGQHVLALDVVLGSGEQLSLGAGTAKDVAGYDLAHLIVGSEGTLALVAGVTLRALPARAAALPILAVYRDLESGTNALAAVRACGVVPAVLEYLDGGTVALAGLPPAFEVAREDIALAVLTEADGSSHEQATADREILREALAEDAAGISAPLQAREIADLWRWRDGVALGVNTLRGGKLSEDVAVPPARLAEAILGTLEIGRRHDLPACSWGHAGDGNLHSTFLVAPDSAADLGRAEIAAAELFALAIRLGGTISGEHGVGVVKREAAHAHTAPLVAALQEQVKLAFDPKGLLNPGKKLRRLVPAERATRV